MHSENKIVSLFNLSLTSLLLLCLNFSPAHAYIGPGLSVGGIVVIFIVVLSLLLAFYAIVWFPIKRRLKSKAYSKAETEQINNNKDPD
ncbi:MAG: hypothetical protein CMH49_05315 [Myxococcales bacterium]|nr:hypothetical protein [Myxococcales bacterium]